MVLACVWAGTHAQVHTQGRANTQEKEEHAGQSQDWKGGIISPYKHTYVVLAPDTGPITQTQQGRLKS